MDELIKDYGHKGIDTPQERSRINYNPVISYIKRVVDEDKRELVDNFVPSSDLSYIVKYNIPAAITAVNEAETSFVSCMDLLKQLLADKVVPVPDGPHYDMIKEYVGANQINFQAFDRACRETTDAAKATRDAFLEGLDLIEAYAYPDMVQLGTDLEECRVAVDKDLPNLAAEVGYVIEDGDIEAATRARTKAWIDWEMYNFFKMSMPEERYFADLSDTLDTRYGLNNDPVPVLSKLVIGKAYDISSLSNSFKNLLLLDIADILADEIDDVIIGILAGLGLEKPEDYQEKYEKAKEGLRTLRTILTITNAAVSVKVMSLTEMVSLLLSPFTREVSRRILYALSNMKATVTSPALDILSRIEKSVGKDLRTVDFIANAIMDKADEIENKFQDIVLDAYRETREKTDKIAEKVGALEKKKWIKATLEIIDAIEWGIDRISPDQIDEIFNVRVDTRGNVYEMIDHLGWFDKE